jgi:hypothetical protein
LLDELFRTRNNFFDFFSWVFRLFEAKSTRYKPLVTFSSRRSRAARRRTPHYFSISKFSNFSSLSVDLSFELMKKALITLEILVRKFKQAVKNALAV